MKKTKIIYCCLTALSVTGCSVPNHRTKPASINGHSLGSKEDQGSLCIGFIMAVVDDLKERPKTPDKVLHKLDFVATMTEETIYGDKLKAIYTRNRAKYTGQEQVIDDLKSAGKQIIRDMFSRN